METYGDPEFAKDLPYSIPLTYLDEIQAGYNLEKAIDRRPSVNLKK